MEARHHQIATIAWCDGHVKPARMEAVYGRWDSSGGTYKFIPTQDPPHRYFDLQ